MPQIPTNSTLNANSVGIINAIRNNASAEYYQAVPAASATTESIINVGRAICAFQPRMNEFINALVNRIALVVLQGRSYSNPWAFAKKGVLDFGETIEEIFVDIADAHPFDPADAETTLFKREKPDVKSMFHAMNSQIFYPVTVSHDELRQAFLSLDGVTQLIAKIVERSYTAAEYDEFIMMKYTVARLALSGALPNAATPAADSEANVSAIIKSIKRHLNRFQYMSKEYTISGVRNHVMPDEVYVITTADFDADSDVDVLAKAFNMDRVNWLGHHVGVDSFMFNNDELERLAMLLKNDKYYAEHPISQTDNENLGKITCVLMDKDFFQVYDNLVKYEEINNGKGLYWNYFLHVWKTYSASPFVNVVMFVTVEESVTSVTVAGPAAVTKGGTYVYTANVVAGPFTNQGVIWSVNEVAGVSIDQNGRLHVGGEATGSVTVTATSVVDGTKQGTLKVTIS